MAESALAVVVERLLALDPGEAAGLGLVEQVARRVPGHQELLARLEGFEQLGPDAQDAALEALDAAGDEAFAALVAAAHEAYYAHPASWAGIGYTTNVPGRP